VKSSLEKIRVRSSLEKRREESDFFPSSNGSKVERKNGPNSWTIFNCRMKSSQATEIDTYDDCVRSQAIMIVHVHQR
jgi:hypothetical protein